MAGQAPWRDFQHGEGPDGTTCPRGHLTTPDSLRRMDYPAAIVGSGMVWCPMGGGVGRAGETLYLLHRAPSNLGVRPEAHWSPEAVGRGPRLPSGLGLPKRLVGGVWGQPWSWGCLAVRRSWGASLQHWPPASPHRVGGHRPLSLLLSLALKLLLACQGETGGILGW